MKTPAGSPVKDATLSFTINQAGIIVSSFAVVASPDTCGTDTLGNLVGQTRRLIAPVVTASTASGTVPSGTYYTAITFFRYNSQSTPVFANRTETELSPRATSLLTSAGHLTITAPTQPASANGYIIYVGTSPSVLKFQSHVDDGSNGVVSSLSVATAPPSTNTTICDLTFNDAIIPSFTFYRVALTLSTNASAPGFPQNWYLAGASVDVSTVYPLANVANATRFPTPLLANPSANATQSVASPVTLNDYSLTSGALYLRSQSMAPPCSGNTGLIYTDNAGVLQFCQNGANVTGILNWFDATTGSVVGNQLLLNAHAISDPADGAKHGVLVYDTGFDGLIIKSHDYGGAVDKPLKFVASSVVLPNTTLVDLASTDGALAGLYSGGIIGVAHTATNSTAISLSYNGTSSTVQLASGITGAGTVRPLAMTMWSPTSSTNREFLRYTLLAGTNNVNMVFADQGDGTSPASTSVNIPMYVSRSQAAATDLYLNNGSADPLANANFVSQANMGTTSYGTTATGGRILDSSGRLYMSATRLSLAMGADVNAANNLTLGVDGNVFRVNGTTTIQCLDNTNWPAGSIVTLLFVSTPTIKNRFACADPNQQFSLAGGVDLTTLVNSSTLTVMYGAGWFEVSRSIF